MRKGFTIVEILVSVAIIGLLMAILVPAVQAAREASRRTECLSNLAQIGKAIHGYESTHGYLPPCDYAYPGQGSAHVHLLPWLDQASVLRELKKNEASFLGPRNPVSTNSPNGILTRLTIFSCPSDTIRQGLNNYAYCRGAMVTEADDKNLEGPFRRWGDAYSFADVTDGLSNTAAVCERLRGSGNVAQFDPRRDIWFSGLELIHQPLSSITVDTLVAACDGVVPTEGHFSAHSGATWAFSSYEGAWYNHAVAPNSSVINCSTSTPDLLANSVPLTERGIFKANSQHGPSVNLLLLDGSARSITDDVDLTIWRGLGTLRGKEFDSAFD